MMTIANMMLPGRSSGVPQLVNIVIMVTMVIIVIMMVNWS